jgi:farnesyl-diphosphate farnesyltransferase
MSEDDWSYCQGALLKHSRSFALPIAGLPDDLRRAITCAYLLCRVADTVEDTAAWSPGQKQLLQRLLLDILEEGRSPAEFARAVERTPGGDEAERELLLGLDRVVRCFGTCRAPFVAASTVWVAELIRGMCIYTRRSAGADGVVCLRTTADLERYCYFVAGTIGHLLTECFLVETALSDPGRIGVLRENAERFAAGLQLVNILRDIPADLARGHCFVPLTLLATEGITPRDLLRRECRVSAHKVLRGLFTVARGHLQAALSYLLALPNDARGIRSFCAIPLWMAVATLDRCQGDPRLLDATERVKLSRAEVSTLVAQCTSIAGDDDALLRSFGALGRTSEVGAVPVSLEGS